MHPSRAPSIGAQNVKMTLAFNSGSLEKAVFHVSQTPENATVTRSVLKMAITKDACYKIQTFSVPFDDWLPPEPKTSFPVVLRGAVLCGVEAAEG